MRGRGNFASHGQQASTFLLPQQDISRFISMGIAAIRLPNIALIAFITTLLLLAPLSPVSAQSGEPIEADQVADIIAGPHAVKVVLINSNLAAGFIHMGFLVTDANTGETVPDARVVIKAVNEKEEYEGWGSAHNSPADPQRYDGRMNLGSTGEWVINVHVSSPLGQGGSTALTLEVPALNRYTDGSLVYFGVFGALALGVAYLFWSVKRQNRRKLDQNGSG